MGLVDATELVSSAYVSEALGRCFVGPFFPSVLRRAKAYGHVLTLADIMAAQSARPRSAPVWRCHTITDSAEYFGTTAQGNRVVIVAHGLGPHTTPARLLGRQHGLPKMPVVSYDEYVRRDGAIGACGIVLDAQVVARAPVGPVPTASLRGDPLFKARAGTPSVAERFLDALDLDNVARYGQWHLYYDVGRGPWRFLLAIDDAGIHADFAANFRPRYHARQP